MKVILKQDIRGLGRKGEIKDVSDGYGKNFLLRNGLVSLATDAAVNSLSAISKDKENQHERLREKSLAVKRDLEGVALDFPVAVGAHDEVFGSVSQQDIMSALKNRGVTHPNVDLSHSLKKLGLHEVMVDLGEGVKAKLKVNLTKKHK